jgi:pimeloyl-ACP methyl ester carboxylesterase
MTDAFKAQNNKKALKKLEKFASFDKDKNTLIQYSRSLARDESMHQLGIGTMRNMKSVGTGVVIPSLLFKGYTFQEKLNVWKGKVRIDKLSGLRREELITDLTAKITELAVPAVFMCGKYDYTVNGELSKSFFEGLSSPDKKFILFEDSAHSPLFEERSLFLSEMLNIRNKAVHAAKTSL